MSQGYALSGQEYLRKILLARIYPVARLTPLHKLEKLTDKLGVGKVYLKREDYQTIHSFKIRGAYNKIRQLSRDQLDCGIVEKLTDKLGVGKVYLKREDYQTIHSFKIRGAYNKIRQLSRDQLDCGIVAASAGNHAQGCALSAKNLGCRAVIVMPTTTPDLKVDAVRRYGAEVVLYGESFSESYEHAKNLAREQGLTLIPPYDDPDVIAGQGTIAHEIMGQVNEIDTIFVQIGGGGLAAGIAVYIKNLIPKIKVIGVEAEGSACMKAAIANGSPCNIGFVSHFADGVAVSQAGDETFRLCNEYLDDIITCSNDEICAAMKDIFDDTRAIAEPSGALSLAGLKKYVRCNEYLDDIITCSNDEICAAMKDIFDDTRAIAEPSGALSLAGLKKYVRMHGLSNGNHIAIMSGANVKFHTLRMVAERCDVGEMTEGIFSVEIPEAKGAFLNFCNTIGNRHVTEFSYRLHRRDRARIFASIEMTNGDRERNEISASLTASGYNVTDLTKDTLAKDHIRYMIGGHLGDGEKERLFLFEFPETKGALNDFLTKLAGTKDTLAKDHIRYMIGGHLGDGEKERLFLFEFPETKGALNDFLTKLAGTFSISLFHFRISGLEYCSVLCGFDVTKGDEGLDQFLNDIKYPYVELTDNTAYNQFLC